MSNGYPACSSNVPLTYPFKSNLGSPGHRGLPLNIIGMIISYLDDIADIARVTRASRLLYYMTLPKLFENVNLRSYDTIRYFNGRPEGYGSGSPFAMGLSSLTTGSVASFVRSFTLSGEWKETEMEDFSKGRVPDKTMLLSIAIRAAIDKMPKLESFTWDLNVKPLQTVFQGLSQKETLTSLSLRFPSSRVPSPCTVIPPMPNLRSFKALTIDPLRYPDDISVLIANARKLESLVIEFSPRIREEGELSIDLHNYFGKAFATPYLIPVKRATVKNSYTRNNLDFDGVFDPEALEEFSLLNSIGVGNPSTVFLDDTWYVSSHHEAMKNLKMCRVDAADRTALWFMKQYHGLERLYFVNQKSDNLPNGTANGEVTNNPFSTTPSSSGGSSTGRSTTPPTQYLTCIINYHNVSLRHLLLSSEWLFSEKELAQLTEACHNLEQLAVAVDQFAMPLLQLAVTNLPKLFALRFLGYADEFPTSTEDSDSPGKDVAKQIDETLRNTGCHYLEWIGLGHQVYGRVTIRQHELEEDSSNGTQEIKITRPFPVESVEKIDIWRMDSLDIFQ